MKVNREQLEQLLKTHVCDIRFVRRRPKKDAPPTRRMLATNAQNLLNSTSGRTVLNYAPPKGGPQYDHKVKNNVITWDLFMQNFRAVSCDDVEVINQWPADEKFWDEFSKSFAPMTTEQKEFYMRS